MATMQPIRELRDIERLKTYFFEKGEIRNYALVTFGINVPLRISDILRLHWNDVYDNTNNKYYQRVTVTENKTGKQNTMALNQHAQHALEVLRLSDTFQNIGDYILKAYKMSPKPMSRVTVYLIIRNAATELGLEGVGCHSLRKTFGYHAWKNGISPALIMEIYNHSSMQITKRYLGIEQDDKDMVMERINL